MPDRPGAYSHVMRPGSMPDQEPPSQWQKVWPVIAYLVPLVFGAGSAIAALRYVAAETDKLSARVERLQVQVVEAQRELADCQSARHSTNRDVATLDKQTGQLEGRVSKNERNLAVLCAQRSSKCEH